MAREGWKGVIHLLILITIVRLESKEMVPKTRNDSLAALVSAPPHPPSPPCDSLHLADRSTR